MRAISLIRSLFLALFLLVVSAASFAQVSVGISVGFGPPAIPVYEQPICPAEGLIWTPGYWGWDPEDEDYYWVPGTWVAAPVVGYLWTPGWWGWEGGGFFFHDGYWGPHVGWYGGINYGFGYFGHGYEGGRWDGDRFYYNRSVTNVNITEIHNVYNTTVINRNETRVSYNGGDGGIRERPSREEESYSRERHVAPVAAQNQHSQEARGNRELRASVNQGRPPIAATQRPGSFRGSAVVPAREAGGRWEPPANRRASNNAARPPNANTNNANRPPNARGSSDRPPFAHAKEITPHDRPAPPNTGNPNQDRKYQQQQDRLYSKQEQEHQRLQQRQEQEHQRLTQQNANDARRQQVEQRHQQQTQQMEQRHAQQQQRMQEREQPKQQSRGGGKPDRP